jgi:hypothetical protein
MDCIDLSRLSARPRDGIDPYGETDPGAWPNQNWAVRYAGAAAIAGTVDGCIASRAEMLNDAPSPQRTLRWMIQYAVDAKGLSLAPTALLPPDLWRRIHLPDGVTAEQQARLRTVYFDAFYNAGTAAKLARAAELLHGIPRGGLR